MTQSSGGMLALFLDYYFLEDVSRVVDSAHREFTSRNYSDTNYHRHHYQVLLLLRPLGTVVDILFIGTTIESVACFFIFFYFFFFFGGGGGGGLGM